MSKGLNTLKPMQVLHFAKRYSGNVMSIKGTAFDAIPLAGNPIISEDIPYFEGLLYQIPGRGGCNDKDAKQSKQKKQGCAPPECSHANQMNQGERKLQCPQPQRPTQPAHCMKIVSYPPKSKDCQGPCPRVGKTGCGEENEGQP